jgi:O-antigen/teichoic acid export membrane protein
MNPAKLHIGFWSVALQWGRFGIAAVVFLLIARWLSLAEIGAFATVAAPVRFLQVLHRVGITDSVVIAQTTENPRRNTDALFVISGLVALLCMAALFACAWLSRYWFAANDTLGPMLVILALVPLFNGFAAVPEGILRHDLRIKALALRTIGVQSVAAIVAIIAARAGAGPWALVLFLVVNAAIAAPVAWALARWKPETLPDRARLRQVTAGFLNLSGQALLANALQPLLQLGVSLYLGMSDAGAFQIALRFLGLLDALAIAPLRFLALPLLVAQVKSAGQIGASVLRGLRLTGLIASLVYLGAASVAPIILSIFVGADHAVKSAVLLQIFCVFGLANASSMVLMQAFIATGQANLALRRTALQFVLTALFAWPAFGHSVTATAVSAAFAACIVAGVVLANAPKRFALDRSKAVQAIAKPVLIGCVMASAIHAITTVGLFVRLPETLGLLGLVTIGLLIYAALVWLALRPVLLDLRSGLTRPKTSP